MCRVKIFLDINPVLRRCPAPILEQSQGEEHPDRNPRGCCVQGSHTSDVLIAMVRITKHLPCIRNLTTSHLILPSLCGGKKHSCPTNKPDSERLKHLLRVTQHQSLDLTYRCLAPGSCHVLHVDSTFFRGQTFPTYKTVGIQRRAVPTSIFGY